MATRYIQAHGAESWRDVSAMFVQWIKAKEAPQGTFGWSEDDSVILRDGTVLFAFHFPNHHGVNIDLFDAWAETTGRLYAIGEGNMLLFPKRPGFTHRLTPRTQKSVPS